MLEKIYKISLKIKDYIEHNKLISEKEELYGTINFNLGLYFYEYQKQYKKAMKYYLIAAKHNHSSAMNKIGCMYERGEGVRKNKAKAEKWIEKSKNK